MGILNYAFYKLNDAAMCTNIYFDFDTTNTILTDKVSRPGFPYTEKTIFIAAPLFATCNFTKPIFRIDPQFVFFDSFSASGFTHGNILKIDFGEGNGWITFDPTKVTNWPVLYSSNGEKTIKTAIFNSSNDLVASSISKITVLSANPLIGPDFSIKYPGITAGFYGGCNGKINSGKTIIYLEGFDMGDCVHLLNRSVSRIYTEMIGDNQIVQLKNEGYNFVVVDWDNSRIDLRFNALYLLNMLEDMKCDLTDDQQFVIIGESMGGLIGRYLLTYMETEYYQNKITSPFFQDAIDLNNLPYLAVHPEIYFLPTHWCKTVKMHNTRLLITLDTPHQGANLPISAQLAYKNAMQAISLALGVNATMYFKVFNLFLDCQAAQQMLIYHVDTRSILPVIGSYHSYDSRDDKDHFFGQLNSMGNYPQYAKVVAMSNGSLKGINQCNYGPSLTPPFINPPRIPGDRLIDFGCEIYGRVLGIKIPLFGADVKAYTNPNGLGKVLQANAGNYGVHIKLKLFGIKVTVGYVTLFVIDEDAISKPYCTSAGGFIGDEKFLDATASASSFNTSNNYWMLNFFHYTRTTDGLGCVKFDSHLGLNGLFSANFDYHLCSDGLQFCFVPVQSALDYGVLGFIPLDHDIEIENIGTKLNMVKADVIIGYPGNYPKVNNGHVGFRNDYIYNITNAANPATSAYLFTYSSCVKYNDTVERGIINMEIGDEELYLENVTLPWKGAYEAEFDIHVNERNPHYQYSSTPISPIPSTVIPGIYSQKEDYNINVTTGQGTFYVNKTYSPANIGLNYLSPHTGPVIKVEQPLPVCCINFMNERTANEVKATDLFKDSYLHAYPNPNNGNQLILNYRLKKKTQATVEFFDVLGKKINNNIIKLDNKVEENTETINLSNYDLANGMYWVRITNGTEVVGTKLIINK